MTAVELQSILHTAALTIASVVPEDLERESTDELLAGAVATVGSALQLGVTALDAMGEDFREDDELQSLAAMARWELRRLLGVLTDLPVDSRQERVLSALAEARRSALASLTAVEGRLAAEAGLARRLAHLSEAEHQKERSLRRLYADFRGDIEAAGQPDGASLPANFIQIARRLERLLEEELLPIAERLQIRSLQRRIDEWLTGEDGWSAASGQRLWMDLSAFAELLVQSQPAA